MQMHLHTHTQTERKDAEHYLSGSRQIPSIWKTPNLELLTALGVMTQTLEIPMTQTMTVIMMISHPNHPSKTILSSRSPMPSLASPTLLGTDPKTQGLHAPKSFLVQCELNFHNRPQAFCSDAWKVSFALSFLKGIALTWFEPDLLAPTPHGLMTALSLSSSSLPILAPTTLSVMPNTNSTTCQ
ncbi:hypothetical protein ID866_11547 [Astraeus odoratus]|nr:hypothetical protein ID866_11547 [Astraeus odoratus]